MNDVIINKSDIGEYLHYGFECPKCGEWITRGDMSDIDVCDNPECDAKFIVKEIND